MSTRRGEWRLDEKEENIFTMGISPEGIIARRKTAATVRRDGGMKKLG